MKTLVAYPKTYPNGSELRTLHQAKIQLHGKEVYYSKQKYSVVFFVDNKMIWKCNIYGSYDNRLKSIAECIGELRMRMQRISKFDLNEYLKTNFN